MRLSISMCVYPPNLLINIRYLCSPQISSSHSHINILAKNMDIILTKMLSSVTKIKNRHLDASKFVLSLMSPERNYFGQITEKEVRT